MGRRKKEPENVHREAIASAAERLFMMHGIQSATMDDIAKEAGYSKATLYVYFQDKEGLVNYLVLKSMEMLCSRMRDAVSKPAPAKESYRRICQTLADYQEQYPLYFSLALGEIHMDMEPEYSRPVEMEIFKTGEQINDVLSTFFSNGIHNGELRSNGPILQTVFLFWGALSGLIQMAANKSAYIEKAMGITKQKFLEDGFEQLFHLIGEEGRE